MGDDAHQIVFDLEYKTSEQAHVIYQSVAQEIGEIDDDRSKTVIDLNGSSIEVTIVATDLVALRAAANTWLSLIEVAENSFSVSENPGK